MLIPYTKYPPCGFPEKIALVGIHIVYLNSSWKVNGIID